MRMWVAIILNSYNSIIYPVGRLFRKTYCLIKNIPLLFIVVIMQNDIFILIRELCYHGMHLCEISL